MKRLFLNTAGYLCMAASFSAVSSRAEAAAFFVSPIRVELSATRPTTALSVQNDSDHALVIQTQSIAWSQSDGEEIYEQTTDLIVTPAIFTVPPKSSQVVRVGLRKPVASTSESSYRLALQEVAGPPKADATGVQMLLRIVLPVFVKPASVVAPELKWEALMSPDKTMTVRTQNDGNAHIQIYHFKLLDADSRQMFAMQSTPAYVLPGQGRQWQLKPEAQLPVPNGFLHLVASTDAGEIDAQIALETP